MKNFSMLDEKEKKKRTWIKRIFILVGIILIIVLANIPFIANHFRGNPFNPENHPILSRIRQNVYREGVISGVQYYIYTFETQGEERNYVVFFWNTTEQDLFVHFDDETISLPALQSTFVAVSRNYSENGGYLNEKEFEFTSGECDFDEPNLTSTLVDGCFSFEYDGNKSLLFLDRDGYIVRAVTTSDSSFCPDFEYDSVWSVKN